MANTIPLSTLMPTLELNVIVNSMVVSPEYVSIKNKLLNPKNTDAQNDLLSKQLETYQNNAMNQPGNLTKTVPLHLNNETIISFDVKNEVGAIANMCTVRLFDKTGIRLQELIGMSAMITYRFGYAAGNGKKYMSDLYVGQVTEWGMSTSPHGITHELKLAGLSIQYNTNVPPPTPWREKRISDIAIKIAQKNGWDYDAKSILQTEPYTDPESLTDPSSKPKPLMQSNESDFQFLYRISEFAKAKGINDPYVCILEEKAYSAPDSSSKFKLTFRPLEIDELKITRVYNVYRTQKSIDERQFNKIPTAGNPVEGIAISFDPEINTLGLLDGMTGLTARSVTIDESGNITALEVTHEDQTIKNTEGVGVKTKTIENRISTNTARLTEPLYDGELQNNRINHLKAQGYYSVMSAKLKVYGDFNIFMTDNIRVNYYLPNSNEKHFTSGIYVVVGVEHSVSGGEFITSLTVYRAGVPWGGAQVTL